MKSLVIDANVFHAFFYESIKGVNHPERTGQVTPIFDALGTSLIAFIDEGKQIEHEWRTVAKLGQEWFDNWLADCFLNGKVFEIEHSKDANIARRYKDAGFPSGRDIWYIRVAHGLTSICKRSRPCLIAEDVDFFDPTKKKSSNKKEIFLSGKGPVVELLRKDGIDLFCIQTFLDASN
jgi:hypothetical protein